MGKRPVIESPVEQPAQVVPDKKQLPETNEQLPEKTMEPEESVEPEKIVEPERIIESEKPIEPEKVTKPEKVVKPKRTVASEKTVEPKKPVSSGRIYKVQILASIKKLPNNSRELKGYKVGYYVERNYYKYTYGESQDWNEINELRKKITKDFKGAFIVAFENGVKVPNK